MSIKYTIDGVEVLAEPGDTILSSATRAGPSTLSGTCSQSAQTAPFSSAEAIKRWPSVLSPR